MCKHILFLISMQYLSFCKYCQYWLNLGIGGHKMTFNATWSRYMQETMGHIRTQSAFNVTLETLTIKHLTQIALDTQPLLPVCCEDVKCVLTGIWDKSEGCHVGEDVVPCIWRWRSDPGIRPPISRNTGDWGEWKRRRGRSGGGHMKESITVKMSQSYGHFS